MRIENESNDSLIFNDNKTRATITIENKEASVAILHNKNSSLYKFFFFKKIVIDGQFVYVNKRSFLKNFGSLKSLEKHTPSIFWKNLGASLNRTAIEKIKKKINFNLTKFNELKPQLQENIAFILKKLKAKMRFETNFTLRGAPEGQASLIHAEFTPQYKLVAVTAINKSCI